MRRKRTVAIIIWAIALAALLCQLVLYARQLGRDYAGVSLRISDTPISGGKLKRVMAQEDDGLVLTAAWTRGKTAAVTGEALGLSAQARPVAVCGDVRQICPMTLLSGSYPAEDDDAGCLVTADVAMALYHSPDAVGTRLLLSGKRYTVRGVISAWEPMIILRSDGAAYENLEFALTDPNGGAARAEAFLYRHGLSDSYVAVEKGLYARMLRGLAFLPAALACLLAAGLLMKTWRQRRKSTASLWRLATAAIPVLLALVLLKNTFYWPQVYLPTKCSDFAFWGELLTAWRDGWKAITLAAPPPGDILFFRAARWIVAGTALALVLEWGLYRRILDLAEPCRRNG